jgi:RNA-directed DNA polymerase
MISFVPTRSAANNTIRATIAHIDEGFEFLGFRIQRQTKRGSHQRFVYTWMAKRSLTSIKAKVKTITRLGTNNP